MEWVEITGPSVAEATRRALEQLGVVEADAEIVVLEEPRTGLFGRVKGEARVRARVRPSGPRPKRTRRSRGSGSSSRGSGPSNTRPQDGGSEKDEGSDARPSGSGQSRNRNRNRNRNRSRSGQSNAAGKDEQRPTSGGAEDRTARKEDTMAEGMTLAEQGEIAKSFLEGLVGAFGLSATVTTREIDAETIELAVDGDDLGILVGPRGATLAAVQEVTRTAVQAKCPSRTDRILVDVARYRERRAKALSEFTRGVVAEVVSTGEERRLEAMGPADRKVVHDTVNELDGAVTRSEGEEPRRYVVISPASA